MPETPQTPPAPPAPPAQPATLGEFLAQQPPADAASAVQRLLGFLAGQPHGAAFEAECRRAGHGDTAMLAALADDPDDKRIKARARVDRIGNDAVLWLTTPGWKATGHPSKREQRPTTQTLGHADAPRLMRRWVYDIAERSLTGAATIEVVTDPATIAEFSETAKSRAWARLQVKSDSDGGVGALTSGLRPDALVIERWWNETAFLGAYQLQQVSHDEEAAEVIWAVEIEDTAKASAALRDKIARLDAAADVGVMRGTIWVTRTPQVARALAAFGIGRNERPRPGHLCVRGWQMGLPGSTMVEHGGPLWWPLILERQAAAAQPRTPFGVG